MNPNKRSLLKAALAAPVVLGPLSARAAAPGVTDTEIRIGQTGPYSGPASQAAALMTSTVAYFKMLNERGGIHGRQLNLISLDDSYSPPKTVELTRKLVEQENVLLMFGQVGIPAAAVQQYLNAKGVPQMMIATGAARFSDPAKFPWTIGTTGSYRSEAASFARYVKQKMLDARIGILYQNDDLGRDYVEGIGQELGAAAKTMIVAKASLEPTEPTFDSQILSLRASGANVLVIASGPKPATFTLRKLGDLGWKPQLLISSACSSVASVLEPAGPANSVGALTTAVFKDPGDPAWAKDPEYQEYAAFMAKYLPQTDKNDSYAVYGYLSAQIMARILTDAGRDLTRESVKAAALRLKDFRPRMAGPDVALTLTPTDYDMFKKLQLMKFNGKSWALL